MGVWLDLAADLLSRPLSEMPKQEIFAALEDSFDTIGVSWNWLSDDLTFGAELSHRTVRSLPFKPLDWIELGDLLSLHPLPLWFLRTGDIRPQTLARVPQALAPQRDLQCIRELLTQMRCDQQLSIPYQLGPASYRAFVLGRPGADFTDDDVALAQRIQRLLRAIDTQARLLRGATTSSPLDPAALSPGVLSARETAVLALLARGCSAQLISRKLGVSPRTVEKHLQHIYRKLGVSDRLGAVRVAGTVASRPGV